MASNNPMIVMLDESTGENMPGKWIKRDWEMTENLNG